ncbi:MAG TPA: M15 family metallopeptidase [Cyclobacteriaceae bacterium]|nr:M15 family metallopeptidase [Cyclobacteriaceae bacterium]
MKKWLIIFFFLPVVSIGQNKYGLKATTYSEYKESLKEHPEKELVDLEKFIPGIVLDIRYATTNNFTGERIYNLAKAYARKSVATSLQNAQAKFKTLGVGVKIYDAYRPYSATVKFYEVYHDTTYVASPYRGSRHNRGCALDMTLIDLKTGKELRMPTEFDSFRKEAWPSTPVSDPEIKKNRDLIIRVMKENGFKVNGSEWWHFDFIGWNKYEVMDINFEELIGKQ